MCSEDVDSEVETMVHNISVCCLQVLFGCFRVLYSLYMMKGSLSSVLQNNSRHTVAGNITFLYFMFVKNRKSFNNLHRLEDERQFPAVMQRALHHIQCLFKVY